MEVSLHRHANWAKGERAGTQHDTITICACNLLLLCTDMLSISCSKIALPYNNKQQTFGSIAFWLQEKCVRYWPAEGNISFGEYNVELKRDTLYETFSRRDLLLTCIPVSYTYSFLTCWHGLWVILEWWEQQESNTLWPWKALRTNTSPILGSLFLIQA